MKRKIHIDRELPDKAAMARHKDFDGLLKKHEALTKRPRYNGIKVITGIIVIAVVAVLVFEADREDRRAINPPLGAEMIDYELHVVNPEEGGVVRLVSGTEITIAAGSLVDEDGTEITEPVMFKVSEFRNPLDFYVSGIPMTYDSADAEFVFESAGMLDIRAFNPDGPVYLKSGSTAQVSTLSAQSDRFNIYRFDSTQNNWQYVGPDQVEALPQSSLDSQATEEDYELDIPQFHDTSNYAFDFEFDSTDFPQLAPFEDVFFEVADEGFDPAWFETEWDSAALDRVERGKYEVSLFLTEDSQVLEAIPVIESENYDSVVNVFEAKMEAYHAALEQKRADRLAQARERAIALEKERRAAQKRMLEYYKKRDEEERERRKMLQQMQAEMDRMEHKRDSIRIAQSAIMGKPARQYTVRRGYQVSTFGIWNCDDPVSYPSGQLLSLRFVTPEGEDVSGKAGVSHVNLANNVVFTYAKDVKEIKVEADQRNLLWFQLDQGRMAWVEPKNFTKAVGEGAPFEVSIAPKEEALVRLRLFMAEIKA